MTWAEKRKYEEELARLKARSNKGDADVLRQKTIKAKLDRYKANADKRYADDAYVGKESTKNMPKSEAQAEKSKKEAFAEKRKQEAKKAMNGKRKGSTKTKGGW